MHDLDVLEDIFFFFFYYWGGASVGFEVIVLSVTSGAGRLFASVSVDIELCCFP